MKTNKWLVPFGMIGVFSFLLLDILGKILWIEYNPVTTYVSALIADEAPYVHLMRLFMSIYTVCFLFFSLAMVALPFRTNHILVKLGYMVLFVVALLSAIGYGGYPISMALIFSKNDYVHVLVTILIIFTTILSFLLISVGYLLQEKSRRLGRICLVGCILYIAFNVWHLFALQNGSNILGLIERFVLYTFHALTFIISWIYTFRRDDIVNTAIKE